MDRLPHKNVTTSGRGRSRVLALLGLALGIVLALGAGACGFAQPAASDLPSYGPTPDFALVDQDGRPITQDDLGGKVVLANFIFTNCPDFCPMVTAKLRDVQGELKAKGWFAKDVILVSFSVDPERDTPAALKRYSDRFQADTTGWRFVTGAPEPVRQLVVQGFKLGVERVPVGSAAGGRDQTGGMTITHSDRMVLIDAKGQVRGYLSATELKAGDIVQEIGKLVG